MGRDTAGDQQRLYRDQCPQRLVRVREQRLDQALLVSGRGDPQQAAGDLEPPPVTSSDRHRNVNAVGGIEQFVQERGALSGRKLAEPGQLPKHNLATSDIAGILEQLVGLGMCSRGFSVDCAQCQMESYVEHSSVTPQATCPGCGCSRFLKMSMKTTLKMST